MSAALNDRLGIVRTLLETAPDNVVRDLDSALRADTSAPLAPVRAMVRAELSDRHVRDVVLAPVGPLCTPRADGFKQALFPAGALSRVWRALRALEPKTVAVVVSNLTLTAEDEHYPPACDELCAAAAAAIRAGDPAMDGLIRYLEDYQPGAAATFASYVELVPLARTAIKKLPGWLRNMTEENAAAVRLLLKDAGGVAGDASPRILEILLAQIAEPWRLLRIVSAMTNRGGDRYLSSSELAEFCERVLADIERRVNLLRQFDLDGGPEAGQAAAGALAVAIHEILEFEECLDLNKEGPWGQRVVKMRGALSNLTEGYLKKSPKAVGEALPLQPVRIGGATLRMEPRLEQAPDGRLVRRAMASLAFFERCRGNAAQGGFGAMRAKAGEEITHRLDSYIEDILAMIHDKELVSQDHARAFLEVAADMIALAQDEKSAQIVRRRAAAAAA
ncbi:MAG: hypothetical protein WDN45_05175 [Caulobacteraceae bacterium]